MDADGRRRCEGLRCTDAEFANASGVCCAVRQTCALGKAESKLQCGGNLWMLMDGQVAKALGALMRNSQMRAVHVVVSGRLVRRVRTMASRAVVGL